MKNKVKNYFKYHHYHTNPALESHSQFMTCLGYLEGVSDKRLAEGNDTDENWSEILAEINKCSEEQLDKLFYMTKIK